MRHTRLPSGGVMSVQTVCLGWHWTPYRYSRTTEDGSPVKPLPEWLAALGARAVGDPSYVPDVALVNFYDDTAKMGMHQDKDEQDFAAPIVSVSLGIPAIFLFGGLKRSDKPARFRLVHGDTVVWGGPSRLFFHGVAPLADGEHAVLGRQRINLTFRKAR